VPDRIGQQLVERLGPNHAAGDERRDTLDRREQNQADALGAALFERTDGLHCRP
jgi:hypothetical protein